MPLKQIFNHIAADWIGWVLRDKSYDGDDEDILIVGYDDDVLYCQYPDGTIETHTPSFLRMYDERIL